MSECKQIEEKDKWNLEAGFYQRLKMCKISGAVCQGSEEVCSNFEPSEEPEKEDKSKEEAEEKEEAETGSKEKTEESEEKEE